MHTEDYIGEKTGLLLVDPYNDFLSPAGKLWPQAKEVAKEINLLSNLKSIVDVARRSGIRIFFVPARQKASDDSIFLVVALDAVRKGILALAESTPGSVYRGLGL
jgi:hypothetical protein